MNCDNCKKEIVIKKDSISTGYGINAKGEKHCYECCAKEDIKNMDKEGKYILYLTIVNNGTSNYAKITNWPSSLVFDYLSYTTGGHNWGLKRYDVWFTDHRSYEWHGYTIGDNTQICHCKRSKTSKNT